MREGKTPPLGEWLQSREGNMPEDYYFGKYDEVAKDYEVTPTVIVPSSSYTFIEGYSAKYINANRYRIKGHKKWHWTPNIKPPMIWMALPQENDLSHIDHCKSEEEILKVVNGWIKEQDITLTREWAESRHKQYLGLLDSASSGEEANFYKGAIKILGDILYSMDLM